MNGQLCKRIFWGVSVLNVMVIIYFIGQSSRTQRGNGTMANSLEAVRDVSSQKSLPICYINSYKHESVEVKRTVPTWQQLDQQFPALQEGGHFKPPNCNAVHNLAIIIPYRDREEHLKLFLQHMHPYLQTLMLEYTLYVVELERGGIFKKTVLMNAGFIESVKHSKNRCIVFHDVDMLPMNASVDYTCTRGTVKHPSHYIRQYEFKSLYAQYLGGVLIFHDDDFRRVNGFSNLYCGWGGEDDDMYAREEFVRTAVQRMHSDGLNNVNYTILRTEKKRLYTWIYVGANQTDGSYKGVHPKYAP